MAGKGGRQPNSGGKRIGAGRPPKELSALKRWFQEKIVSEWTTEKDLKTVWDVTMSRAMCGDPQARADVFKYVLGMPPQPVEVTGESGGLIQFTVKVLDSNIGDSDPESDADLSIH